MSDDRADPEGKRRSAALAAISRVRAALSYDIQASWQSLRGAGAARSMATLAGGLFVARLFTVAGYLLVAWFYAPADFGVFSIYLAVTVTLLAAGTGGYGTAIVAEEDDGRAHTLLALCTLIGGALVAAAALAALFFAGGIAGLLGVPEAADFMIFVPVALALRIGHSILVRWAVRAGRFREQALSQVALAAVQAGGQAGFALADAASTLGLVIADIAAAAVALSVLALREVPAIRRQWRGSLALRELWTVAWRWRDLPRFDLLSSFIFGASQQGPVLVAGAALGGGALLGQVAMGLRLAQLPLQLITGSLSSVAMHRMASADSRTRLAQYKRFTRQLLVVCLAIYIAASVALFLAVPWLLGDNWARTPEFFTLLIPLYIVNATVLPVWVVFTLVRRLGRALALRLALLLVLGVSWALATATGTVMGPLLVFSLGGAALGAVALIDMGRQLNRAAGGAISAG